MPAPGHGQTIGDRDWGIMVRVKPIPLLVAASAGALMALQGTLNSLLSKSIGLPRTTFVVHVLGTVASAALLLIPWPGVGGFAQLGKVQWYALLGGPIGVVIVLAVATSINRVGVGLATTSIIVAQLLTAYAIDHFGLFGVEKLPFGALKVLGIALMAAGGWLLLR